VLTISSLRFPDHLPAELAQWNWRLLPSFASYIAMEVAQWSRRIRLWLIIDMAAELPEPARYFAQMGYQHGSTQAAIEPIPESPAGAREEGMLGDLHTASPAQARSDGR